MFIPNYVQSNPSASPELSSHRITWRLTTSPFQGLLRSINDVSSSDLALVHELVHLVQFAQSARLIWCIDQTTSEELDGLCRVASITDVWTLDCDHLDDRLKDRCTEICTCWKTNGNDCPTRADILFTVSLSSCALSVDWGALSIPQQLVGMASRWRRPG